MIEISLDGSVTIMNESKPSILPTFRSFFEISVAVGKRPSHTRKGVHHACF